MEILYCEFCKKEHDGSYGSGRFCSYVCKQKFAASKSITITKSKKTYGIKCECEYCNETFNSKRSLNKHLKDCELKKQRGDKRKRKGIKCKCKYCGKIFNSKKSLENHLSIKNGDCEAKKNLKLDSLGRVVGEYDHSIQAEKARITKTKKGILHKGHEHSIETRVKIAESMILYRKSINTFYKANVSKKACDYIDKLNKEKGWNLIHGLNGKEKQVGPYFLDGYDENLNIAFEYDEKAHHKNIDTENRDKIRQQYIINQLHCEFWRYDEKTDVLYKVN